jgi:hypothetical protein
MILGKSKCRRSAADFLRGGDYVFLRYRWSGTVLKCTWIALVFARLLVLSSWWVTSIHPLYEDDSSSKDPDVVSDQSLIGSWMEVGGKCTAPLTI